MQEFTAPIVATALAAVSAPFLATAFIRVGEGSHLLQAKAIATDKLALATGITGSIVLWVVALANWATGVPGLFSGCLAMLGAMFTGALSGLVRDRATALRLHMEQLEARLDELRTRRKSVKPGRSWVCVAFLGAPAFTAGLLTWILHPSSDLSLVFLAVMVLLWWLFVGLSGHRRSRASPAGCGCRPGRDEFCACWRCPLGSVGIVGHCHRPGFLCPGDLAPLHRQLAEPHSLAGVAHGHRSQQSHLQAQGCPTNNRATNGARQKHERWSRGTAARSAC